MEVILQKPELPTGCESVALTMVLKQKGYSIEKTTIAEEYLIYNKTNYASGYVGILRLMVELGFIRRDLSIRQTGF